MDILNKIRRILLDESLDLADKIVEIHNCLPEEKRVETFEMFGCPMEIKQDGNFIIFDGGIGCEYTDNPRLENPKDLYYSGRGCTWGVDLDGKRYWKKKKRRK